MFTKALVVDTPKGDDNHFRVRIPIFEDTTGTEVIYDALCCYSPGTFGGLNIGDCVYVTFEDAKLNVPVIIGRLYTREADDYAKGLFNNLQVTNMARLPINTSFGDVVTAGNLVDLVQNQSHLTVENIYPVGAYFICDASSTMNPTNMWPGTTWASNSISVSGVNLTAWRRTS